MMREFVEKEFSLLCRCGNNRGRVSVKRITFRYPDEAKITSAKTVAAQGTWWPVKLSQRVTAIGKTYVFYKFAEHLSTRVYGPLLYR